MRNFKFLFLALISCAAITSCSDEVADTTKPVINLIEPADGDSLLIGSDVHFEMELSDDVALSSYKVDIHSAEGHSHAPASRATADTYSYTMTWYDIEGQKNATIHHHEIEIPEGVDEGEYHFVVYCLDTNGNESYVANTVILSNTVTGDDDDDHDHDDE